MTKRIARLAMLTAMALVLSYIERLIPLPVPVPGIKLGLANLVTLVCLYLFGFRDALTVSVLRVSLAALLFGSGFSMVYGLSGALLALLAMALLKQTKLFSPISVSAAGGFMHSIGQLLVAALVTKTAGLLYYFPPLMLSGALTGALIGLIGAALIHRFVRLTNY